MFSSYNSTLGIYRSIIPLFTSKGFGYDHLLIFLGFHQPNKGHNYINVSCSLQCEIGTSERPIDKVEN